MRFIFRITLLSFFISLNLLSLQLLNLRGLPSEAYWISFKVWDTNPGDVFVMHPDGSNQRFVAHLDHAGNSNIFEWSTHGQSLYFFRWATQDVFSVNPAGRQLKKIVEGNVCRDHVTFSPNNEWLIVALEQNEQHSLFLRRTDGTYSEEIYKFDWPSCAYPVWSPDGQWLAMTTHNGGVNGRTVIVRMTPDGNDLEVIAPPPDHYLIPTWSPDGNWIGYIAYTFEGDEQTMGAYIMRADGSDKLMLSAGMKYASFADWSPDSEWILFAGHDPIQGYASAIFKIKRDGTQLQQIFFGQTTFPKWSPDGQWIVFGNNLSGSSQIYRMKPDGTEMQRLTDFPTTVTNGPISPLIDHDWHPYILIVLASFLAGVTIVLGYRVPFWFRKS